MSLMQMKHTGLTESYFVSSFIAGLNEGTKHYLFLTIHSLFVMLIGRPKNWRKEIS
jgi:hypothetical protein